MLKVLDVFELKERGTILYCKDDDFSSMTWDDVKDYVSKISKIIIIDKELKEKECSIKKYDVMNSLSDKISVAFLIDKRINNNDIMIPSDVTVVN